MRVARWALVAGIVSLAVLMTACARPQPLPDVPQDASPQFLRFAADTTAANLRFGSFTLERTRVDGTVVAHTGRFDLTRNYYEVVDQPGTGSGELRLVDGVLYLRPNPPVDGGTWDPSQWYEVDTDETNVVMITEAIGFADWLELARATTGDIVSQGPGVDGTTRYAATVAPVALAVGSGSGLVGALSLATTPLPATFDVDSTGVIRRVAVTIADPAGGAGSLVMTYEQLEAAPDIARPTGAIPFSARGAP